MKLPTRRLLNGHFIGGRSLLGDQDVPLRLLKVAIKAKLGQLSNSCGDIGLSEFLVIGLKIK